MESDHLLGPDLLSHNEVVHLADSGKFLVLQDTLRERIRDCRMYLDQKQVSSDRLYYGINTGFGSLCEIRISAAEIESLQMNLVRSHACGIGELVPEPVVRIMMLLKILSLSKGYSGVSLEVVERLLAMYNAKVHPVLYQLGSLGASGDLAPLAHMSLPLLGEGQVWAEGSIRSARDICAQNGWQPLQLQSKEGLALLNGTQFSTGYASWCLAEADRLYRWANLAAAASIDGFDCLLSPFDPLIQQIRPHSGQIHAAAAIRDILTGSAIAEAAKTRVQDPYSFRCVPQVHGATYDVIRHVAQVIGTEINAVTDNPNVFMEEDAILSGGNFHAQPIALALDYLALGLSELGSISERRVFQLISGKRELPEFLTEQPGLHSGLMIPQYTAASIASQNKQLCTPASADSITSCMGQEDHVSMAANAATKCYRIVENLERLLAIEWMTAMQALEFRRPLRSSPLIEELFASYRQVVPKLEEDRVLSVDMAATVRWMRGAL